MKSGDARPLVSVLIAARNSERTLARAVESVLGQTYPMVEVVIADDGSTDSTPDIAASLTRHDSRVVAVRRASPSGGPAAPRNLAISRSRGELLALLDHDDQWLPDKLAHQVPKFTDPRVGVVYSDCWTSDGRRYLTSRASIGHPPSGEVSQAILRMNFVPACTAVWRRSVTDRVGLFAESLSSIDDRDLWIRAALAGAYFAYVDEPLAIKDTGPGRLSTDRRRHDELAVMMWERLAAANPSDGRVVEQLRRARWHLSSSYARDHVGGSLSARASTLWRAARLDHSPRNLARIVRLHLWG